MPVDAATCGACSRRLVLCNDAQLHGVGRTSAAAATVLGDPTEGRCWTLAAQGRASTRPRCGPQAPRRGGAALRRRHQADGHLPWQRRRGAVKGAPEACKRLCARATMLGCRLSARTGPRNGPGNLRAREMAECHGRRSALRVLAAAEVPVCRAWSSRRPASMPWPGQGARCSAWWARSIRRVRRSSSRWRECAAAGIRHGDGHRRPQDSRVLPSPVNSASPAEGEEALDGVELERMS
jgi:hypothetical protein